MDKLIIKYFNNELNHQEWEVLQKWLDESDHNKIYLNNLEAFWRNSDTNLETARKRIWEKLEVKFPKNGQEANQSKLFLNSLKIAASILLVFSISFIFYQIGKQGIIENTALIIEKETNPGQRITTKLPDGSMVMMNGDTRLKFPETFDKNERVVELEGEAFFDVEHNPAKPFLVISQGSVIKVMGTSFNVRTCKGNNVINVAVATGKVSFNHVNIKEGVILSPNEMITYKSGMGEIMVEEVDALKVFGWKDKILYFKNEKLDEIIQELERWYGVQILLEGDFSEKGRFTGEFEDKSLENVLIGLSYLYEFDYKIENDVVILK